ncbi:hypothetical protein ANN_14952 [Periplaneta americana]|uniref:Uncharacterized protein n=1 Tax=Periplaneta americana TaxID=6978 RepID=A0ABQ8SZ82_PERAM|nr:hypothetical protein ANN_14952 [Periplaneta americana]
MILLTNLSALEFQVIDHMKQLAFTQRKELDHLKYMKKQELKKLKQLQAAELNDFDKLPGLNLHKPRYTEQTLTNKIENVGMRYNAAAKINKIYRNITEILKQDSLYFDTVLRTLEVKSVVQSCASIKQTRIGQETTEDLANIKEEYEILEHEVKGNMCQRDLAVQSLRGEVHHLYRECLGLVRVKSDRDIQKQRPTESELDLPKDLERLEDILSEIEAVTHGSTYDDIFPRHEEEEARILGEIEFQEKREGTMEVTIKERRDLLAAIRSSLQVIYEMVSRVNTESEDKVADLEQLLIVKPSTLPVPSSPMLDDDGAPSHFYLEVREYLNEHLPQRWCGRASNNDRRVLRWPPRSPDLTPCDFFLWRFVKDQVYVPPLPVNLEELNNRIRAAVARVDRDMLQRVWQELRLPSGCLLRNARSINRAELYKAMVELNIPKKLMRLVKTCMDDSQCQIKIQSELSDLFQTTKGLRQGDSPALLEDLDDIEDPNVPTRADIKKTDQMDMQLGSANTKSGNPNNQGKRI